MTEARETDSQISADLGQEFLAGAEPIAADSGRAWLGMTSLYTFFAQQFAAGDDDDEDDPVWSALEAEVFDKSETLVRLAVRNPGPPDWDWSLNALRIGERGHIWMMHEDGSYDPSLPIFAAWEPYDDQQAFEAAFIAGHARNFIEYIHLGTHYERGSRVSASLWERALRRALDDEQCWPNLADMFDDAGPTDTPEQRDVLLRRYLTERDGV